MDKLIDETGHRFGRLLAVEQCRIQNRVGWTCRCDCGNVASVRAATLRSGTVVSCGCFNREQARLRAIRHGGSNTAVYKRWRNMIQRCYCPTNHAYARYGGRGITVCKRWLDSFTAFRDDMGEPPSLLHSVDRDNNDGNYEPGNCRWATDVEQGNNKRNNRLLTWQGRTQTMAQWAHEYGLPVTTVFNRLLRHWTLDRVFSPEKRPTLK